MIGRPSRTRSASPASNASSALTEMPSNGHEGPTASRIAHLFDGRVVQEQDADPVSVYWLGWPSAAGMKCQS